MKNKRYFETLEYIIREIVLDELSSIKNTITRTKSRKKIFIPLDLPIKYI